MKAYCYILYSKKLDRFYTGACQENLEKRIIQHNNHTYGTHRFTATSDDWELFLAIQVNDYAQRKGIDISEVEKWLKPNLGYQE